MKETEEIRKWRRSENKPENTMKTRKIVFFGCLICARLLCMTTFSLYFSLLTCVGVLFLTCYLHIFHQLSIPNFLGFQTSSFSTSATSKSIFVHLVEFYSDVIGNKWEKIIRFYNGINPMQKFRFFFFYTSLDNARFSSERRNRLDVFSPVSTCSAEFIKLF